MRTQTRHSWLSKKLFGRFSRRSRFETLEDRYVLDTQIGAVIMPYDGYLSAAVYDPNGQLVRTLFNRSPQEQGVSVALTWDGLNDSGGKPLVGGTYSWKALTSQVETVDEGAVGDSVFTNQYDLATTYLPDMSYAVRSVTALPNGDFYNLSTFVENANGLQHYSADGQLVQRNIAGDGMGIANDGTYLYATFHGAGLVDSLAKIDANTGGYVGFTSGAVTINTSIADPRPAGQDRFTTLQERTRWSSWGVAADTHRVWVSDYRNNTVKIYDKVTGSLLGELKTSTIAGSPSFSAPLGIAVEASSATSGTVWVAYKASGTPTEQDYEGDTVARFTYTVSGGVYSFTKSTTISGLDDPSGLTIGGPSNHLFVALTGADQIKQYDISSGATLAGLQTFGTKHIGGPVQDNSFIFKTWAGVSIDSSGVLNVVDDHRVQRFYTTTGGGHTAGDLKQSLYGIFGGAPIDSYGYTSDGRFFLVQGGGDTYEVDPSWTGGPREGWLGDGAWRLAMRDVPIGFEDGAGGVHRTLLDGTTQREFRYGLGIDGVSIAAVDPTTGALKHVAAFGGLWYGYDRIDYPTPGGRWSWFDTNGDGAMTENEISHYIPPGQNSGQGQGYVDESGTIWFPQNGKIVKFTLQGFSNGIPQYDFANPVTVVDVQPDFGPAQVKVAGNGDIWAIGGGPGLPPQPSFNPLLPGQNWIARFDSNGNRLMLRSTPDSPIPAFAVDKNPASDTFVYTGHARWDEFWIYMWDADGLMVAKANPGAASGYTAGWIDHPYGVGAFTHPLSGKTYLFGSDIAWGKNERFRLDNLDTIQRDSGTFSWTVPVEIASQWKLDDNLLDSVAHNDGVFNGGSAAYVYGPQGKAIDLNGASQSVTLPYGSSNGAYTLSAWVRASNTVGVNVAAITSGGVLSGGMDQISINKDGKFEHYTLDQGAGVSKVVTSTTVVQPNTWYHVAIAAENNGMMRLYVNGQEEGTALSINRLFGGTNGVILGGAGAFTPNWLDGSIDDVRTYKQALSATDIRAIYDEAIFASDGYWALDGVLNDSAGGNNGTFNGTGSATYSTGMFGNALNFNGTDNYVSAMYTADPEAYTISAWVKWTGSGADNILVRTSSAGPATVFSHQLRINSSGKFEHYTDDGTGKVVTGTTTAVVGAWYHVVGTANNNGLMRLYVNGVEEGTSVGIGTLSTAGDRWYMGSNSGGGMGYFAGLIDDVHVYNEVATAADVRDQFLRGEPTDYTGKWNFDGNLNDSAGSVHGTYHPSGSPSFVAGQVGSALSLDGISQSYVNLPYTNDPGAYTVSAWIRPDFRFLPSPGVDPIIPMSIFVRTDAAGPAVSAPTDQLKLTVDNNVPRFEFISKSDKGNHLIVGSTPIQENIWYHVALVAESNGMMHLFLNGQEDGTPTLMGNLVTTGDRWQIGNLALGGLSYYSGLVDDFRIYERALTRMEVESTINGKSNPDIIVTPSNVTVKATDPKLAEAGQDPSVFTITRDGNLLNALVVNYTVSGVATSGSDFSALAGSVTIPAGQTSATVTLTPIDDGASDPSETVIFTLSPSANYNVGTPASATVIIADNEVSGDVAWLGSNNTANSNNFGWKGTTNAGASAGEIGGTFARSLTDSYYGDANLAQPMYGLGTTITASGTLDFTINGWNASGGSGMFIGHFSTNSNNREFVGIEIIDNDSTSIRWRARVQGPSGGGDDNGVWNTVSVDSPSDNHTFSYSYDPSLGSYGRLSVTIDSTNVSVDLQDGTRLSGAAFDAFGMGYTNSQNSEVNANAKADIFIDDNVSYTGRVASQLPTLTIAATDPTANEQGATTGTFTVTRSNTIGGALVVNYTVSGTATSGSDFSTLAGSVTIASGQNSATITVTPIDDGIAENSESIVVALSSSANYFLGVPKSAGIALADNEPIVSVTATDANAGETGGNTGTFTFTRTNTSGNLVVNYVASGTATSGADYSALAGSVTIANGQSSATVTVTPINDSTLDGSETVTVEITPSTAFAIGSTRRATLTIADDDAPGDPGWTGVNNTILGNNYGWSPATKEAAGVRGEIGGVFTRSQFDSFYGDTNLSGSLTVNDVITASGKFDLHNISMGWAEIADGVSNFFIGHFSESLTNGDRAGLEFERIRPDAVQLYARFGGANGNVVILNADGNHTFNYTYDPNLGPYGRMTILIDAGTPNALTPIYVDLNAGERAAGITLDTFGIAIPGNKNTNGSSAKTMEAYIDDVTYSGQQTGALPTVTISATDDSASETGPGAGTFTVTRTGTSGSLVVNLNRTGTATNGSDYSSITTSVTIPNGQSSATITVTPIDDATAETDETVILTLATSGTYLVGSPNSATVTIADNEPTVTVVATDASATEGADTGTFTFTRVGNTTGNLVVNFTRNGTATNATDYSSIASSVTILNGQASATVTVTPIDDAVVEGNETVILTINSSANYFTGTPNSATVTIADNEPTITVSATDASASETGPDNGTFTVTRVGNTTGNLVVFYAVGGTATSGSDFTALPGSVTIANGQATATVTLAPIDDSLGEVNETVSLTISSNASYTVGTPNSAVVTIADNEPTVTVTASEAAAEQGAVPGTFTLTRTNTNGNLVVNYTIGGTATSASDYSALASSVTIANGQSSATVTVSPIDDTVAEGNETVVLNLSSSSSYFVGTPGSATLDIVDNEPTVTVTATDPNAAEQGTDTGTFTFTRNFTSSDLVVNYVVSGTATSGADYSALAGSVTIANGQSTATVTVTPIDDSLAESITPESVIVTVTSAATYFVGTPASATVSITDNETANVVTFTSNPNWTGSGNTSNGNSYQWSSGTSNAGGATGEAGGTFARNTAESSFGDTNLADLNGGSADKLNLSNTISASGRFDVLNVSTMDGEMFVGHYSTSTSTSRREFIGMEILEQDNNNVRVRARMYLPTGDYLNGAFSGNVIVPINGNYNFEYTYDPTFENDATHSGAEGQLTLHIFNDSLSYNQTLVATLTGAHRDSGASFDAFGMGIGGAAASSADVNKKADIFIDNVSYTGLQALPTITVNATDASAAEQGQDPGTFTITRTGTSGSLVVNYTLTGTATNSTDYSSIASSVTIANGQSSATITVTPIDDGAVDANETVILTVSTNANYIVGAPNSGTITITDNDSASSVQNFSTSPSGWTGSNNNDPSGTGNNFAWSQSTSEAGGSTGEAGGTFTRAQVDAYFGHTGLSTLTLGNTITSSGKFDLAEITSGWAGSGDSGFFIGHFSTNAGSKEFIGLEFKEDGAGSTSAARVRARYQQPATGGADTEWVGVSVNGNHTYSYTYDPSLGTYGRLTFNIDGQSALSVDLNSFERNSSGAQFDAFGMGMTSNLNSSGGNSGMYVRAFIDDVSYTGFQASASATVTVTATDPNAAEAGVDAGLFTISRSDTAGDLTVNYTITGTATNNSDYSSIGSSVVIPNGSSSVTVSVTPIDDSTSESSETVILTISSSGTYNVGSPSSATVTIADNDVGFTTDPGWVGNANTAYGNSFGWSSGTSQAGGSTGEVGGTFARSTAESTFGDVNLSQTFTLNNGFSATGLVDFLNVSTFDGEFFLGHYSSSPAANKREFVGIEFFEQNSTTVRARARMYLPNGDSTTGAFSTYAFPTTNGNYHFSYTYDPSFEADASHAGPEGRVMARIWNDALTFDQTMTATLTGTQRDSGATFNAFGMGVAAAAALTSNSGLTAQAFIDNVSYSGYVTPVGATVTISASDASAAELGQATGTFTVTRSNAIGNLTVNYTISGTGTSGTDYSALSGSVTIPDGQTSATITVTPIDDSSAEAPETVVLTLSSNASYTVGSPNSATVTIADNDVDFASNPNWTGVGNIVSGENNYGYSATNNAGGSTGEIGGKFIRNNAESYYADTNLTQSFTLTNAISGSGRLAISGQNNTDGEWFLGHLSTSTSDRSMVGIEFLEQSSTSVRFRAKVGSPDGQNDSVSSTIVLNNGAYNYTYSYDPSYPGTTYGRITVRIYNDALTVDQTAYVNLSSGTSTSGATFNAFGIGITAEVANSKDANKYVNMYVDNVNYSGYQKVYAVDGFESGNGSGGAGWSDNWTLAGAASVTTSGTPANGSYHLQLTGNTGSATRAVNLSGVTDARLEFNWKANSFESGETAVVEIYNGTSWVTVMTVVDGQDDNIYHHASISLANHTLGSSFQVRIRSLMSASDDFFYVDDLIIAL